MELIFNSLSPDDLEEIASKILEQTKQRKFALRGQLGAGKTTLIKAFCKKLGVQDIVTSPTFNLLNEYIGNSPVHHFDFYRIKEPDEILALGFLEIFHSDDVVFVEWPEKAGEYLPEFFTIININVVNNSKRQIICK